MAHQGTRYTLEKQVFVQASHAEQSWQVPYAEGLFLLRKALRAWQTLWQQANITVTGDLMSQKLLRIHSYHLLASASPFSNQAQALTSRLPPEACMVKRIVDIFSGMKFLFYLLYSTLS